VLNLLNLIRPYLAAAWHRKWSAVAAAWLVCILGWTALECVSDIYETSARLFIDTDALLVPLLKGIAVDTGPDNQLQVLQKNMLSHANIDKLITAVFPAVPPAPNDDRERLLRRLTKEIEVVGQDKNLFSITYRDRDPMVARDVVGNIITIFLDSQSGIARAQMDSAQLFLHQQIDTYEQQLTAAENGRARYLADHTDVLQGEGNFAAHLASARVALETARTELADSEVRLHALQAQVSSIPRLLSTEGSPTIILGSSLVPGTPSTLAQQLAEAEEALSKLRLRFTEEHPDVRAAEKLVATLRVQAAAAAAPDPTNLRGLTRNISNPVYEQVRLKIVELETNIASLNIKVESARAEVARLEKLAREAPGIEAEYKRLDRDYTVLKANHDELLSRLESAKIAAAADLSVNNRKLQVIEPPRAGQLPVSPRRLLVISGILGIGFVAFVGVVIGARQFDRSFNTTQMLRELGRPVLGGVSVLMDGPARHRSFVSTFMFVLATVSLLCLYGGLMSHAAGLKLPV